MTTDDHLQAAVARWNEWRTARDWSRVREKARWHAIDVTPQRLARLPDDVKAHMLRYVEKQLATWHEGVGG